MTYEPAQPRHTIEMAGKSYDVVGTFELIDAVEWAMKDNIVNIAMRCLEMPVRDMATILSVILSIGKEPVSKNEIGEILLNSVGVSGDAYTALAINVYYFLRITISKPQDREAESERLGELLGKLKDASLGLTTALSA